jgi:hypothetical protein
MQRQCGIVVLAGMLLGWFSPCAARGAEQLDKYGGVVRIVGHAGESFHPEKIGQRWWAVTPEGHGMFDHAD